MPAGWALRGDALDACGLRLAVQRIGASHWRPQGLLRSWGLAPLQGAGDTLCVPCGDDEALWLGAWPDPPGGSGTVLLREVEGGPAAQITVPQQDALTSLPGGQPIARLPGQARRKLLLAMQPLQGQGAELTLMLMAPGDWQALAGRTWGPLAGPPPRPPRLG